MLLFKLRILNEINYFIVSSCLLLFTSCAHRIRYNVFTANNSISMLSMKDNMGSYKKNRYVDFIRSTCWDTATERGFLSLNNNDVFDFDQNNDLEEGLGYIFFNTLRAKLHGKVQHTDLKLWGNNEDVTVRYNGFRCPKPWKYAVRTINGKDYGVFYLYGMLMGEYHRFNNCIINNYTNVESNKSPHTKIYYRDKRRNDQDVALDSLSVIVEIDHLLKDNSYLIELPKDLHKLKTSVLDPFIIGQTETERIFNRGHYWRLNNDYLEIQNGRPKDKCPCGQIFQPPNGNRIVEHTHDRIWWLRNFSNDWMPKMKSSNMP